MLPKTKICKIISIRERVELSLEERLVFKQQSQMVKDLRYSQMVQYMKDSSRWVKLMVRVEAYHQKVKSMKVNSNLI
jgi:hypothetical protein